MGGWFFKGTIPKGYHHFPLELCGLWVFPKDPIINQARIAPSKSFEQWKKSGIISYIEDYTTQLGIIS